MALLVGMGVAAVSAGAVTPSERFAGPPPLVPRWAFAPWVWEDSQNTRAATEALVDGYRERGIPVGAVIVDSPWSTAYTNFEWDERRYPDAGAMIRRLHAKGVRVVLWLTGCLNRTSKDVPLADRDFDRVKELGFAVDEGGVIEWWKGAGRHLDFTSAPARAWWAARMDRVAALGIDGWKVDQGEAYLPERFRTSEGEMDRDTFKNWYYAAIHDYALTRNPAAITLARPFSHQDGWAAPIASCSVGWSGDFSGDWSGIRLQLDNLYRSAAAGYGVLAVEVGGYYEKPPTKSELIRYAQLGALMPVMSNGGSNGGLKEHLPWCHDEETVRIYRYFATLHSELGDYLFSCAVDAHRGAGSVVRRADSARRQHQLGSDVFVSVVAGPESTKPVRLPDEGQWIDWWQQERVHAAGAEFDCDVPLARYPIFVRAGAAMPLSVCSDVTGNGDASSAARRTLLVFPAGKSRRIWHLPTGDGTEYVDATIEVDEGQGTIAIASQRAAPWRLRVKSFTRPERVEGAARWSYDAETAWTTIDADGASVTVRIVGLTGYESRSRAGHSRGD